jgi:2-C-methyl-D-erythritol 4-phosphate cytidylyltransferase
VEKMVYAIIVAAGEGKRAGFEIPKQFVKLKNKTVLRMSAEKFQHSKLIDKFFVVSHRNYVDLTEKEVRIFSKFENVVIGGSTRQQSVYNALLYLNKMDNKPDFVCIHDAVRPFVDIKKIDESIYKAKEIGGAVLAEMAENTVSQVNNGRILKTLERSQIYLHHTPQTFDFAKLLKAYQNSEKFLSSFTDDASIFIHAGYEAAIVEDYKNNIKLTKKEDFELAGCMFK